MKALTILVLALALVAAPLAAGRGGGGGGPNLNCNCHMCPVARGATLTGYEVVSALTLVHVDRAEFLT